MKRFLPILLFSTCLYSQEFNSAWEKIPSSFKGDDIVKIVQMFDTKRGEFESTEIFKNKIEKYRKNINDNLFFFCENNPFYINYNADKNEYNFKKHEYLCIDIKEKKLIGNGYVGVNSYGVKKQIKEIIRTRYSIINTLIENFQLPLAPEKAKHINNDIGIALIVKPFSNENEAKWTFESSNFDTVVFDRINNFMEIMIERDKPTISHPEDIRSKTYIFGAVVRKIVVYQKTNKAILGVISCNEE